MTKAELKIAQHAIEKLAKENDTTPKMVRAHMQLGILAAFTNPDPAIRAEWVNFPKEGDYPTPEEVIIYYANKLKD